MKYPVKHLLGLGVILFALWLGLSGLLTPLMLSLGLASTLLTLYLTHRMDVVDHETYPVRMRPRMVRFWLFLAHQIILANIDVIKRIFKPGKNISPALIDLPVMLKTDVARVVYANSITLTPGTVSVNLNKDTVTVHALSRESVQDLSSGRMAKAIPQDDLDR